MTTKIRCPIVMTNLRSQNVTTLSKNEIRSQNVVADEDTIRVCRYLVFGGGLKVIAYIPG